MVILFIITGSVAVAGSVYPSVQYQNKTSSAVMMIGQEEGPASHGIEKDQPANSHQLDNEAEGSEGSTDDGVSHAQPESAREGVIQFRDLYKNPIIDTGLLFLIIAFWYFLTKGKGVLDRSGRPVGMSLRAALPVLGWYFIILPILLPSIVIAIYGQQDGAYFQTVNHAALLYWLGHLVSLPVLLFWWMGRRNDLRYQPHPNEGAWRVPNLLNDSRLKLAQERGPRSWWYSIVFAIPAIFITYPAVAFTNVLSAWMKFIITGTPSAEVSHETLKMLEKSPSLDGWTFLVIAAVVIGAPIFEEVIFRGTLQSLVRSMAGSSWIAVMLTSAFFASRHLGVATPESLPGLFMLALGMGAAYVWTGRLITPIIMHMLFNAGNILLLLIISGQSG